MTAGATILAAIVPAVLFLMERRDRRRAENDLKQLQERERWRDERAQAQRVVAWIDRQPRTRWRETKAPGVTLGGHATVLAWVVVVANHADLPVYGVNLTVTLDDFTQEALPEIPVIPPGALRELEWDIAELGDEEIEARKPSVTWDFFDAAGKQWVRNDYDRGKLDAPVSDLTEGP